MKSKIAGYPLVGIPPLTSERPGEMEVLVEVEVDLTDPDAPEWSDAHWKNAVRGKFYRSIKTQVTTKLDADVIAWLRAAGRGYQTRMNAILRKAMLVAGRGSQDAT